MGRPLVDRLEGSQVHNLKELRPGSAVHSEIRIIFVFDPWRSAILLVGGDKSGDWSGWYRRAIPRAEELYAKYVKEREAEEGQ
ncbi:type II toxin-antitoxin system RelE/ParE family toxin [Actinocorallia populi]|uniref:type II toxin-antitoxin system RelE/ParE family toxin n=1 Tax=Actinocorallia populi TaxID=2079200 RepID=UPI002FCD6FBD